MGIFRNCLRSYWGECDGHMETLCLPYISCWLYSLVFPASICWTVSELGSSVQLSSVVRDSSQSVVVAQLSLK
jgi:hypothetical protein